MLYDWQSILTAQYAWTETLAVTILTIKPKVLQQWFLSTLNVRFWTNSWLVLQTFLISKIKKLIIQNYSLSTYPDLIQFIFLIPSSYYDCL